MAISNKSGLKSGSLKYSDIFIKWEWKLFLPLQCKSNDIKTACLTRDSSSLKTSVFLKEDTICFHSFPDIFCVLCFVLLIQTIFQYLPHLQSKQKVIFTSRNYHWKNINVFFLREMSFQLPSPHRPVLIYKWRISIKKKRTLDTVEKKLPWQFLCDFLRLYKHET